jgi:hypothetical protein
MLLFHLRGGFNENGLRNVHERNGTIIEYNKSACTLGICRSCSRDVQVVSAALGSSVLSQLRLPHH